MVNKRFLILYKVKAQRGFPKVSKQREEFKIQGEPEHF